MKKLLALSLLVLSPNILYSQITRDTTIYTATRIRTSSNGNIISVSVIKTGIPVGTTTVIHDTVIVKSKPDTIKLSLGRDTVYWSPQTNAVRDSVLWFGPYLYNGGLSKPVNFKLPLGPSVTTVVHDTIRITRVDTVKINIPAPPCICNQPPPNTTSGLFIYDIPSRVGEMNVYNDSTYLGRLLYQDNQPGKIWFAFQFKQGESLMLALPLAYADSLTAMQYLLHPNNPPPNSITLNPHIPQLPGALVKPNENQSW